MTPQPATTNVAGFYFGRRFGPVFHANIPHHNAVNLNQQIKTAPAGNRSLANTTEKESVMGANSIPVSAGTPNPEREPKRLSQLLTVETLATFMGLAPAHVQRRLEQAGWVN